MSEVIVRLRRAGVQPQRISWELVIRDADGRETVVSTYSNKTAAERAALAHKESRHDD